MVSKTAIAVTAIVAIVVASAGMLAAISSQNTDVDTVGKQYSITYELNGGIADPDSPTSYISGEITDLGCPTNEDENLGFFGWYLDKDCTKNILYISADMSGDLTLYALWDDSMEGHGYKLNTYTKVTQSTFFGKYVTESYGTYSQTYLSYESSDKYLYRSVRGTYSADGTLSETESVKWSTDDAEENEKYTESDVTEVTLVMDGWEVKTESVTLTLNDDTSSVTHTETQYYIYGWLLVMVDSDYETESASYESVYQIDSILSEETEDEYTVTAYAGYGITVAGDGDYAAGATVTLTATGDSFKGWYDENGDLLSSSSTYTVEKILTDYSVYALNKNSYDSTIDTGKTFTNESTEPYTWTLTSSDGTVVETEKGTSFSYVFDSIGAYTLTSIADDSTSGKVYVVLADGTEARTFEWSFGDKDYSISLDIKYSDYYVYESSDIERDLGTQGTTEHDLTFITYDDKYVKQIADYITKATKDLDSMTRANVLLRFTQEAVEYKYDSESKGQDEYWKYPLETLYDTNGDCEDTAILFCAVGKAMGYNTALMIFNGHATGAIDMTDVGYTSDNVKMKSERIGFGPMSRIYQYNVLSVDGVLKTYLYNNKGDTTYYLYCETTSVDDGKGNEFTVGVVPSYSSVSAVSNTYSSVNVLKVMSCGVKE